MPHLATLALLLFLAIPTQSTLAPQKLWWPNAERQSGTPKGLLYTPDLLTALVAGRPAEAVPPLIIEAIRDQSPIVVMWTFLDESSAKNLNRPFHASISEPRAVGAVAPLWEKQDAAELRAIDPSTRFGEVGVMAPFPRNTLQPGRLVFMYAQWPDDGTGAYRVSQVVAEVPRVGMVADELSAAPLWQEQNVSRLMRVRSVPRVVLTRAWLTGQRSR
jgi:hypothetical protein